jgi:exosortase/archaeosortase family protein
LNSEYANSWLQVVRQDGTPILFSVDPACSGIYSLMGFLVFALFMVYLVRGGVWKKAVAFSIGFPLIYSLNIVRLTATVLVGYYLGEANALNLFHFFGGWILVFIGTLLLLLSFRRVFRIDLVSRWRARALFGECHMYETAGSPTNCSFCFTCGRLLKSMAARFDRTDLARVLVLLIAVILITAIQMPISLTKERPGLVVNAPSEQEFSTEILPSIDDYSLSYVMRDMEFERRAKQDLSLIYSYVPDNRSEDTIWVLLEIASIKFSLHRTEGCLTEHNAAGEKVEELALKDYQLLDNPPVVGRFCVFHHTRSGLNQTVMYWKYEDPLPLSINSTVMPKYVKISLVSYPVSLDQISASESRLLSFATSVTDYWKPVNQWSEVALALSSNRYALLLLSASLLFGTVLFVLFERSKDKKADAQAYRKLPPLHKQVVDAVSQTQRSNAPTFSHIWSTFRAITGQRIEKQEFHDMLQAVEKTEAVKSGFVSIDDCPFKVWRTRVSIK